MRPCRSTREPLAGTAPQSRIWWLVEDSGPWGDRAPATSRIPGVCDLISDADRRVLLARPTVRRERREGGGVRLWIVDGEGAVPRCFWVDNPEALTAWPAAGLPGAQIDPSDDPRQTTSDVPTLLVCTNAARDACCGIAGRDLLRRLGPRPGLWECSHLGGHRFAPTALQSVQGMVYGRLTADAAATLLADPHPSTALAGQMRGSPAFSPEVQAAQIAVFEQHGVLGVPHADSAGVTMTLPDGTTVIVDIRAVEIPPRPVSCGKAPTGGTSYEIASID